MNKNIRSLLATACMAAGLTAAQADTTNLTSYSNARFDAYGANVGVSGPENIIANGNTLTGLIGDANPAAYQDYRTIWQFKLDTLPFTAAEVVSATVNWTGSPIYGGYALGIDRVHSDFTTWNTIPMYGSGDAITSYKFNGSGANDCTGVFQYALANATANSGLALRFYCAGNPGDYVAGGISGVNIDVTYAPVHEPSTYALVLGGVGSLLLFRRRRAA